MKLKVCGMKYPDNIIEVSKITLDFMGFIFYEKSNRFFDNEIPVISDKITKVGVFVNATLDTIHSKIKKYDLKIIQLHGNESPEFCKILKSKKIDIIKAFSISDEFNFNELIPYEEVCDYFLFDTKGKLPGGNGTTFNWRVLDNYQSKKPLFLSGGIGLEEIEEIKKIKLPIYAIDVNSKFEIKPGLKDTHLLEKFKKQLESINIKTE